MTTPTISRLLETLQGRVRDLEQKITNPAVVGQYPSKLQVTNVTVGSIPYGGDAALPDQPTNLAIASDALYDDVWADLTWTAPPNGYVDHYRIELAKWNGTTYDAPAIFNTPGINTSARLIKLIAGTHYGVRLTPIAADGRAGTPFPDAVSVQDFLAATDHSFPAAPVGLTLYAGTTAVTAGWTDNTEPDVTAGAGTYQLQSDTTVAFNSGALKSYTASATSLTVTGLTGGTTYYFRVRAIDKYGNVGPWSTASSIAPGSPGLSALTDGNPPPAVSTPTMYGLLGALFVKWPAVTNADRVTYDVHIGTTSTFTPSTSTLAQSADATAVTIKDIGGTVLSAGTTYYAKIVARDPDGSAAPSPASAGTTTVSVQGSDIASGSIDATKISATSRQLGSNITYTQSATPTGMISGDLWIDTGNGNVIKQYNGTAWSPYQFADAAISGLSGSKLASGTVTSAQLGSGSVTSSAIATGAVGSAALASGAVTSSAIASGAVGASQVSFTARNIGGITTYTQSTAPVSPLTNDLWIDTANGNVIKTYNGTGWVVNNLATGQLSGTISSTQLATGAVTSTAIASGAVTSTAIASGAVGSAAIAAGAVDSTKVGFTSGGNNFLDDSSFESGGTANWASVGGSSYGTPANSTAQFYLPGSKSLSITSNSAANTTWLRRGNAGGTAGVLAITPSTKYVYSAWVYNTTATKNISLTFTQWKSDNTFSADIIQTAVSVPINTWTRLVMPLTSASNATQVSIGIQWQAAAAGELIYVDNVQLEQGDVVTAYSAKPDEILPSTVTGTMVAPNTLTGSNLVNATIGSTQLASGAVTSTQLAANAVTSAALASGAVGASALAANAVTATAIAASSIDATKVTFTARSIGGITTYTQSATPTGMVAGDLWIDTGNGNVIKQYSGSAWSPYQLATAQLSGTISASQVGFTVGGGNLINNSSFEAHTGNAFSNWSGSSANVTLTAVTGWKGTGTAIRYTSTGSGNNGTDRLNGTQTGVLGSVSGVPVIASFYARRISGTGGIGIAVDAVGQFGSVTPTASWARYSLPFSAGNTTAQSGFAFYITVAGDVFEIDDVQFEYGNVATSYAPRPDEILPGTVTGSMVADTTITGSNLVSNTITAAQIANATITATQIANAAIDATKISATARQLGGISTYVQSTTPTGMLTGDLWIDTGNGNVIKQYNGTAWTAYNLATGQLSGTISSAQIAAGAVGTTQLATGAVTSGIIASGAVGSAALASGAVTTSAIANGAVGATQISATARQLGAPQTYIQSATPTGMLTNDLWIDTGNGNVLKEYNGTAWVSAQDAAIATAQTAANNAQTSANGKAKVYRQATQPTGVTAGDTWFDTSNGNRVSVYDGSVWQVSQLQGVAVGAIDAGAITTGSLAAARIAAGTITGTMIASATVAAANIVSGTITSTQIAASTITASNIASATITGAQIAATTISAGNIVSGTITSSQIASGTIVAGNIASGTITGTQIAGGTITANKLLVTVGGGNRLTNSSFENGSPGWGFVGSPTVTVDTTKFFYGTQSLKLVSTAATGSFGPYYSGATIAVQPGSTYTASAWIYATSALTLTMGVDWYAVSTYLSSMGNAVAIPANTWTRVSVTGAAAATADHAIPTMYSNSTAVGITIYYDAVQFEQGDIPTEYSPKADEILPGTIVASMIAASTITAGQIASGTITATQIASGTITGTQIAATTIAAGNIVSGTITTSQIAASTITGGNIAANTITGSNLVANTITASQIASGTITATQIAAGTITGTNIAATGTITGAMIAGTTIAAANIISGTLTSTQIAAGGISADRLVANSLTTTQIQAGGIAADRLVANSLTTTQIAAGGIAADRLVANSITAGQIAAGAIGTNQLAAGAVTAGKLLVTTGGGNLLTNSSFTDTTLNGWTLSGTGGAQASDATLYTGHFATKSLKLTMGTGYTYTNQTIAVEGTTPVTVSFDVYMSVAGIIRFTLRPNAGTAYLTQSFTVPTANTWVRVSGTLAPSLATATSATVSIGWEAGEVAANVTANIDNVQAQYGDVPTQYEPRADEILPGTILANMIAANVITSSQIQAGGISADRLVSGSITTTQIQAGGIAADRLVANSLTTSQIAAGGIAADRIVANSITTSQITAGGINADRITAATITATQIAASAITADKMAAGTITAVSGVIGSIDAATITVGTIQASQIAAGAIGTTQLAANSVTATAISAGAVTTASMTAGAINGDRITTNTLDAATIKASTVNSDLVVGARIKTADTGARVEINTLGIFGYGVDAGGNDRQTFALLDADGSATMAGSFTGSILDSSFTGSIPYGTAGFPAANIASVNMDGSTITNTYFDADSNNGGTLLLHTSAAPTVTTITTTGTWVCPAGVTSITAEIWGGGGAGATGGSWINPNVVGNSTGGGGGGGGEYTKVAITVVPGRTYNINIGAAGLKGAATNGAPGGSGGQSTMVDSTTSAVIASANGGVGGTTAGGGNGGSGSTPTTHYNGGKGGSGGNNTYVAGGGGGASAKPTATGNAGGAGGGRSTSAASITVAAGAGGTGATGTSGAGAAGGSVTFDASSNATLNAGANATAPGGGGGGGSARTNRGGSPLIAQGGNGAAGQVKISYTSGNPVIAASIAGKAGTDQYGNNYPAGTVGLANPPIVHLYSPSGTSTWTKPAGLVAVRVRVVGGGGGGGGATGGTSTRSVGGGGGSGSYSEATFLASALGATETVTVGGGGAGGTAGNNAGSAGVASSFGAHLTANGGGGGAGMAASTTQNAQGGAGGSIGTSSGQSGNAVISPGQPGLIGNILSAAVGTSGAGASSALSGGAQAQNVANAGTNAIGYGGGGSGGHATTASSAGGNGAAGAVIVEEYY